jgi:hypothetical protein
MSWLVKVGKSTFGRGGGERIERAGEEKWEP